MQQIKRPLAVIGFTFFITGSTVLSMPREYIAILLALFALFTIFHHITERRFTKHLMLILITAVIASAYTGVYTYFYQKGVDRISVETQNYIGYISRINNADNTSYMVTLLDEKRKESFNVDIYYGNGYKIGDTVCITGKFRPAQNDRYIFYDYSQNIKGSISAENVSYSDIKPDTIKYKFLTLKKSVLESAAKLYRGEYLAVVNAMGYNDSHLITSQLKSLFKTSGISHALVISGLHIGIIVLSVQKLLVYLPVDKKIKNIVTAVVVVCFMQTIGLSPSVVRAGFLAMIVLLSCNFKQHQDSVTSLALIGLVSVIANPYITRNIGAMLSYTASLGLVITNSWCNKRGFSKKQKKFICACAAVVFTMPVLALADMYVTVMSPIYNLVFAVFITIICVLSVVTPLINFIPVVKLINTVLVPVNKFVIAALINALTFIETYLDFATLNLAHPVFITAFIAALVAGFVAYIHIENNKHKKIFIIAVSIFAIICYNLLNWNVVTITAFDSGREGSFHISATDGEYLVITEAITAKEAEKMLLSVNGTRYRKIYYCPKEFKGENDLTAISDVVVNVSESHIYTEKDFTLISNIKGGKKLFTISAAGCDLAFGHGKVECTEAEYYFLGNDKPKQISADEIYIFGNTPKWMEVENIYNIDSDIKIKINVESGRYKTVKDVLNFGYRLQN